MPVFIFLIVLGVIVLWFLISFLYKPIGKLVYRIFKDAKDVINEKDIINKQEDENE